MPRKSTKKGKYKLKTHKATAKRFRLTGTGKLVRTKGGKSHFRRRTSKRTKAMFTAMIPVKGKGFHKTHSPPGSLYVQIQGQPQRSEWQVLTNLLLRLLGVCNR